MGINSRVGETIPAQANGRSLPGLLSMLTSMAGRIIDQIEKMEELDNTLIFYIWGDNGILIRRLIWNISEQLAQNGIPTQTSDHLQALNELGGLDALGGQKTITCFMPGGPGRKHPLPGNQNCRAFILEESVSQWQIAWPKKNKNPIRPSPANSIM